MSSQNREEKGKLGKTVEGAEKLSLGISMVVAILMGIGLGIWMKHIFHQSWLLWLGVFWGVAAAIMNIRIEYKKLKKSFDKIEKDPKYKEYKIKRKEEEDDLLEPYEK